MQLCTREQMRELDRRTIEEVGIAGVILMEVAGRATAEMIDRAAKSHSPQLRTVAIFCGGGNNGGDGYVIARHLDSLGYDVDVLLLAPPQSVEGDAWTNLEILRRLRPSVIYLPEAIEDLTIDAMHEFLPNYDIYVDALLGTGLVSEVRGNYRTAIRHMNERPGLKVAVDIPSGLDANTGWALGTAFQADYTCTFGMAKNGLFLDPGRAYVGEVEVADIGILPETIDEIGVQGELLLPEPLAAELRLPRARETHKGDYGHVAILAGSRAMPGAAALATGAALCAGPGLTSVATCEPVRPIVLGHHPEAMVHPILPETGSLSEEVIAQLDAFLERKTAIAIGPGIGREPLVHDLLRQVLPNSTAPVIIDADGLNALADDLEILQDAFCPVILTPHPGEMARLTGVSVAEGMKDPVGWARALSEQTGAFVVLKFSTTVLTATDGRWGINTTGNPGMATGGMGDVLTGFIAGLLATGMTPWDACRFGVFAHGKAGDLAREHYGERALRAGHVLDLLTEALRLLD